ncbi:MAG: hypothetical protein PV362_02870 [Providencia heimbachae]|nr:hypothetical protein [Providencia heimbachae]
MRFIYLFVFIAVSIITNTAHALDCVAIINTNVETKQNIEVNDVVIPESSANGAIIWESGTYANDIECSKGIDEYAYFYPFPDVDVSTIPSGMVFGIIYNNQSYDLSNTKQKIKTDIMVKPNQTAKGTISVKVYIKKSGSISNGFSGQLPIYQLDGEGGLNTNVGAKNFRLTLSNLSNIATANCSSSFSNLKKKSNLLIDDNLISSGTLLNSIGNINVTCTPANVIGNRMAIFNIYTTTTDSQFGTNKEGLTYDLLMDNNTLKASNKKNNPIRVTFKLDNSGKNSKNINQHVTLNSTQGNWLYAQDTETISNDPKVQAELIQFD